MGLLRRYRYWKPKYFHCKHQAMTTETGGGITLLFIQFTFCAFYFNKNVPQRATGANVFLGATVYRIEWGKCVFDSSAYVLRNVPFILVLYGGFNWSQTTISLAGNST